MSEAYPVHIVDARKCGLRSIPWAMIAPHERQATINHDGQSLRRLAARGGLSLCEMIAVLEDREWTPIPIGEARAKLLQMVESWQQGQAES